MRPNFFLVGAPKSGTTSLFHYLTEHPDVYMCPIKEPNFFSAPDLQSQGLYYSAPVVSNIKDYENLFEQVRNEKAVGEASVSYLFYADIAERIKKTVLDPKIIILLRDPVKRGFSHYLMDSRLGYINSSFEDIIYKSLASPLLDLYYQQVVELGLYFHQVKRYLDTFGAERVKIFLSEDLKNDNSSVMDSVCEFLDIEPCLHLKTKKQYNVYRCPRGSIVRRLYTIKALRKTIKSAAPEKLVGLIKNNLLLKEEKPEMSPDTRDYLVNFYKKDVRKLSNLIGRDLRAWSLIAQA